MDEFGTVFCLFFRSVWARPGSKRSGSGFDSAAWKPAGFNSIGIRSHEIGSGFNLRKGVNRVRVQLPA